MKGKILSKTEIVDGVRSGNLSSETASRENLRREKEIIRKQPGGFTFHYILLFAETFFGGRRRNLCCR